MNLVYLKNFCISVKEIFVYGIIYFIFFQNYNINIKYKSKRSHQILTLGYFITVYSMKYFSFNYK